MVLVRCKTSSLNQKYNCYNNNKGDLNLSFQKNTQITKKESYDSHNRPSYFSHSVGLHADYYSGTTVV